MKIIHFLHPSYHPKIVGYILKNNCVCLYEVINDNENEAENEK